MKDLIDRIGQLEEKLAPPPKPTFNDVLRAKVKEQGEKNTKTVPVSALFPSARKDNRK